MFDVVALASVCLVAELTVVLRLWEPDTFFTHMIGCSSALNDSTAVLTLVDLMPLQKMLHKATFLHEACRAQRALLFVTKVAGFLVPFHVFFSPKRFVTSPAIEEVGFGQLV